MPWKKSESEAVLGGREEVRQGPKILKLEGGSDGKFKSTIVRVLPPREDAPKARWYTWANAHFSVGPNNRNVRCLQDFEQFCPVCAEAASLRRDGLEKESAAIRQQVYGLVNVVKIDRETGKPDGGVQIWRTNPKWLLQLVNQIEEEYEDENIDDPNEGRNITIRRTGTGMGGQNQTSYEFRVAPKQTVFNGGDFALLETMYDLENIFPLIAGDKLLAIASGSPELTAGVDPFDDDDDDDVEDGEFEDIPEPTTPPPAAKKKKKDTPPAPVVVPAPAKKKKAAPDAVAARDRLRAELAKAVADDEDDDEDDEE